LLVRPGSSSAVPLALSRMLFLSVFALLFGLVLALAPAPSASADDELYIVQEGDTIYDIAGSVGMDVDELISLNHLADADSLQIGQPLKIRRGTSRIGRSLQSGSGTATVGAIASRGGLSDSRVSLSSQSGSVLDVVAPADLSERYSALSRGKPLSTPAEPQFRWPCAGYITTYFGEPGDVWIGGHHPGLDIAARTGQPIWAAESGVVLEVDVSYGYGNYVKILHSAGYVTLYGHLSQALVEPGDVVEKGQVIGAAGSTGISTGPHLHFELRRQGERVDPLTYLP
jgi:murein DD-endopeptidase MepM/ murein hydrolase activator NlpD